MTVKELKDLLNGIPDEAIIYCDADHGQTAGKTDGIAWANHDDEFPCFDFDEVIQWNSNKEIKPIANAVLICGVR